MKICQQMFHHPKTVARSNKNIRIALDGQQYALALFRPLRPAAAASSARKDVVPTAITALPSALARPIASTVSAGT